MRRIEIERDIATHTPVTEVLKKLPKTLTLFVGHPKVGKSLIQHIVGK